MKMKPVPAMIAGAALLTLAALPAVSQSVDARPKQNIGKMDKYVRSYQDAVKYYQNGQFKLAEKELLDFLEHVGEHAGGNFLMGMVQVQLGDFEKARTSFRTTVKLDPAMVAPRGWLGALDAALGNPAGASEQKAELEKIKTACAGSCPKAAEIAEAIQRIDENVAAAAQAKAPS